MRTHTDEEMKKAIKLISDGDESRLANAVRPGDTGQAYDSKALLAHTKRTVHVRVHHIMNAARMLFKRET